MKHLLPVFLVAVTMAGALVAAEAPAFRLVANPQTTAQALQRRFVADAFFKKVSRWPDGTVIHPADLGSSAPSRERFSLEVLQRTVPAVKSYWEQNIFSGRDVPPPEFESDEAMLKFVSSHPGAIGYVSGSADVSTVKVISIEQ